MKQANPETELIARVGAVSTALRAALEGLVVRFGALESTCFAISGSVARGEADRYSDLDLWLIVESAAQLPAARQAARRAIEDIGDAITSFPATHLGADNLLVGFTEVGAQVVKLDVEVVDVKDFRRPVELMPIRDANGIFARLAVRQAESFDVEEADRRMAGWLWYAYAKAARGERFEAVDALDVMRKLALVPILLHRRGKRIEGYRRLERKLETGTLDLLQTTYPKENSTPEIVRALAAMARCFQDAYAQVANPQNVEIGLSRIARILEAIERDWINVQGDA